jgi:hypothetical protein
MPEEPESCWTAIANIVRERPYGPGGAEVRFGTKHFAPGAKVYIIGLFQGTCERITVVGMHRKAKQLIAIVIDVKLVENLRVKVCYAPAVLAKIRHHYELEDLSFLSKEFAETVCEVVPFWQAQSWRHPPPEAVIYESATLKLLREAAASSTSAASADREDTTPISSSLPARLWQFIRSSLGG